MADQSLKWYVVRAVSGKEKKVKQYIEAEVSRLGVQHLVPQVLIPMEKYYQMRDGKKVAKERNYYPGYVLIEATLDGEIEHIIKNLNSVIGFLGDKAGNAIPLRQAEINRILGKVDEMAEQGETINVTYYVGEAVKVVDGPFNGFTGEIEEVHEDKKKLTVMVKVFGRKTPLELNYMQVDKE
ncbi:transcription termination/antitermination factor NusG [Sphingobacterium alkalisoli]|uniref:Transcription termination/antitermination protein NusG n=1 Tax=Sphingobacterium alkalisoli TaxID=1874115 RepID=A0A4U0H9Y8_9SPHI|nr:transcription termination/antitermination protein NusG [Sphingobacterium alkalisoli]TJY68681.1 transcription termination/antitermination factor NusG [Sphingobacterium alkalisoli]GGH04855.1 transcription termination/antitermination protein NusG [Sphingobacterium alkalisoli]